MKPRVITTEEAPSPVARYSQGILGAGLLFTAGQGGFDPDTGELIQGIGEQTRRTLENIDAVLRAGGSSFASALKVTIFLQDLGDFEAMNEVYSQYVSDSPLCRTTVQAVLGAGMLIEIDASALAGSSGAG